MLTLLSLSNNKNKINNKNKNKNKNPHLNFDGQEGLRQVGTGQDRSGQYRSFFGPKILVFGPKIRFLPYDPILVNDAFVALGVTVHFPHWERFFDFPFPSYSHFL